MTLYQQSISDLSKRFHTDLNVLVANQHLVDKLEDITELLNKNDIECTNMLTVYSHVVTQSIGLFIFPTKPSDDDLIKLVHYVCASIDAQITTIKIIDKPDHPRYGYEIKGAGDIRINISMKDHKEIFTPDYLQHLLGLSAETPLFPFINCEFSPVTNLAEHDHANSRLNAEVPA